LNNFFLLWNSDSETEGIKITSSDDAERLFYFVENSTKDYPTNQKLKF